MYEPELKRRTISELLGEDVSDYFLPTIQREFVWDEDDIKQMMESLLNGYPIGIITVFKTDIEFPSVPLIDSSEKNTSNLTRRYVLDGQQRLTSVLLLRNGWKIKREGELIERTQIYFNPDDRTLRVKGKRSSGYDFSDLIRMCMFAESPKPHLQKALEYLRKNFLDRPVAFYEVEVKKNGRTEEEIYKHMSEIFIRINRAGIRLGNLEMFLSFFASASLGKKDVIETHRYLNQKYSMDLEPFIRFVFSNLSLSQSQITKTDQFKKAVKDIRSKYSDQDIKGVIDNCKTSIENTMAMLRSELGISTTQIFPSETVLVPLFQHMYLRRSLSGIDENDKKRIIKWFLLASYNGLYSSSPNTKVESDLKLVKQCDIAKGFPLDELLRSMKDKIKVTEIGKKDFTNIDINILRGVAGKKYLFLEYVLLCRHQATDWTGRLLTERTYPELDRHHIFPKDQLATVIDEDSLINHIGNLTFIDRVLNEQLQGALPKDYLENFDADVLKKHFVPLDRSLWELDKYEQFVEMRTEMLWQGVETLMHNLGNYQALIG